MNHIDIHLDGDNAWPDLGARRDEIIHLANDTGIGLAVLPGGMTPGLPSVAFRLDLPDGRSVVAETSWRLLASSVKAIAARYGWPE
jgi:hypothetical protein